MRRRIHQAQNTEALEALEVELRRAVPWTLRVRGEHVLPEPLVAALTLAPNR